MSSASMRKTFAGVTVIIRRQRNVYKVKAHNLGCVIAKCGHLATCTASGNPFHSKDALDTDLMSLAMGVRHQVGFEFCFPME